MRLFGQTLAFAHMGETIGRYRDLPAPPDMLARLNQRGVGYRPHTSKAALRAIGSAK